MTTHVQVNPRGGLTLPMSLRKQLGLESGGTVMAEASEGGILLRPAVSYPIEMYTESRVAEFDAEEQKLRRHLSRKRAK